MIVWLILILLALCPWVLPYVTGRLRRDAWTYVGAEDAPSFQNGFRNASISDSGHLQ